MDASRCRVYSSVAQLTHQASRLGSTVARLKLKGIDGGPHKRWSMWFNSKQRAEPYQLLTCPGRIAEMQFSLRGREHRCCMAVVSSCRDVGLSPATSATLALSCHHSVGHSRGTAGDKPEEGGDDVKSSWPLQAGLHTCYNGGDSGTPRGDP